MEIVYGEYPPRSCHLDVLRLKQLKILIDFLVGL